MENDWANRPVVAKPVLEVPEAYKMTELAQVMGTLDAGRAREMIAQIPSPYDELAGSQVAAYLNLDAEQKRSFHMDFLEDFLE